MFRRWPFVLYVLLSLVDFAATVFLVGHGYANEANPLIREFASMFTSFSVGLAVYKVGLLAALVTLLKVVHRHNPDASGRLLVFANTIMLCLGAWHCVCLSVSVRG